MNSRRRPRPCKRRSFGYPITVLSRSISRMYSNARTPRQRPASGKQHHHCPARRDSAGDLDERVIERPQHLHAHGAYNRRGAAGRSGIAAADAANSGAACPARHRQLASRPVDANPTTEMPGHRAAPARNIHHRPIDPVQRHRAPLIRVHALPPRPPQHPLGDTGPLRMKRRHILVPPRTSSHLDGSRRRRASRTLDHAADAGNRTANGRRRSSSIEAMARPTANTSSPARSRSGAYTSTGPSVAVAQRPRVPGGSTESERTAVTVMPTSLPPAVVPGPDSGHAAASSAVHIDG